MKAEINGTSIFYEETGPADGLPVIFIHAFPLNHAMWQKQVKALPANCRAICYDIRGLGESDAGDGQYTLEYMVDDLLGLMDKLNIAKAVLCGLSMGGYIALRLAEKAADRVKGLILADTRAEADGNEAKLKRAENIRKVKEKGVQEFADGFLKTALWEETYRTHPELVKVATQMIAISSPKGIAGALLALASRTDTKASLHKINCPVLLLVGEHDAITPPIVAEGMHEEIKDSEMHIIHNAAHLSNLENPEEFNTHLVAFLNRLLTSRSNA